MKLKSLKKKLQQLEANLQKDAKKLAKLQRKVESALKTESARSKSPGRGKSDAKVVRSAPTAEKKKRNLTPEGRAKLAALMKARWDAKRAGIPVLNGPEQFRN
jgi:hypothetical protein